MVRYRTFQLRRARRPWNFPTSIHRSKRRLRPGLRAHPRLHRPLQHRVCVFVQRPHAGAADEGHRRGGDCKDTNE